MWEAVGEIRHERTERLENLGSQLCEDEKPRERFTPGEVVRLMDALIHSHDHKAQPAARRSIDESRERRQADPKSTRIASAATSRGKHP